MSIIFELRFLVKRRIIGHPSLPRIYVQEGRIPLDQGKAPFPLGQLSFERGILGLYPLCNASWMSGKASFGPDLTGSGVLLKIHQVLHRCHFSKSAWQAQLVK